MIDLMFRRFCLRFIAICGILRVFSVIFRIFAIDSAREIGYNVSRRAIIAHFVVVLYFEAVSN